MKPANRITYASSGVDIAAGDAAKREIARIAKSTFDSNVMTQIGLFAGAYDIGNDRVLLSSVDGVGTKIKVAAMMGIYDTVGIDLVHHCANDIAVHNATPLFFLDYIGHSDLVPARIAKIVRGLAQGCKNIGAALIGGETAQMPGIYAPGEFDLVGFIVGVVEKNAIITGERIVPGDAIIALPANGLHTNGYSLARKVLFDMAKLNHDSHMNELGETIGAALLRQHPLYIGAIRTLQRAGIGIHGMAHITGGGIAGNLVRVLPDGCRAIVRKNAAPEIPIFKLIQKLGDIAHDEMFATFNMGFGFLFILPARDANNAIAALNGGAFIAGDIIAGARGVELV